MILLTEKERQLLKESASNISMHAFQRLEPHQRRAYWEVLDRTIQSIMMTHPEAFTAKAVADLQEKQKNSIAYNRQTRDVVPVFGKV